ncbi:MAG: nitroreductase family protein [Acidimicrobiales bacterium]|nr:nitroreductase family protein [Acidimicrobiales bacterium]
MTIDRKLCTSCGACVRACYGKPLELVDGRIEIDPTRLFGCIACGACLSVCPTGAVSVSGRDLGPGDLLHLAPPSARAGYPELLALLQHRRSVRRFTADRVAPELVARILDAAVTAPMGIPPSEVGVLLLEGRDRVQAFSADTLDWMQPTEKWLRPLLPLARPFVSRSDYALFRDFVFPAVDAYLEKREEGVDWLTYDAPLAMVFYGTGLNDPADPYIPATLAVVAAEALGLGSCMLGFAGYGLFYDKALRRKWGLPDRIRPGVTVIFGHPATKPKHGVQRRFSAIVRG